MRISDWSSDVCSSDLVTLDQLSAKATVASNLPEAGFLSRQQRLQRWSELLAREPHRLLTTFPQTEYMDAQDGASMRCADSALPVSFDDAGPAAGGLPGHRSETRRVGKRGGSEAN